MLLESQHEWFQRLLLLAGQQCPPFPALAAALRISAPGAFPCRLEQLGVNRSTEVPGIWANPFHEALKQARSTYHELVAPNTSATGEMGLDRQGWEIPALAVFSIIACVFIWFLGLASTVWSASLLSIYNQHQGTFFKVLRQYFNRL